MTSATTAGITSTATAAAGIAASTAAAASAAATAGVAAAGATAGTAAVRRAGARVGRTMRCFGRAMRGLRVRATCSRALGRTLCVGCTLSFAAATGLTLTVCISLAMRCAILTMSCLAAAMCIRLLCCRVMAIERATCVVMTTTAFCMHSVTFSSSVTVTATEITCVGHALVALTERTIGMRCCEISTCYTAV